MFPWLILLAAAPVVGLAWFIRYYLKSDMRKLLLAQQMVSSPFGTVRVGQYVKLVGKLRASAELFNAPLGREPCVFYKYLVTNRGEYETVLANEQRTQDVYLEEASGVCALVLMAGAHIVTIDKRVFDDGSSFGCEEILQEGATVAVFGVVRRADDSNAYRGDRASIEIEKGTARLFLVTNDPDTVADSAEAIGTALEKRRRAATKT
jgi:hypothetical protein